jgi:Flp pilus assembly protein TadG
MKKTNYHRQSERGGAGVKFLLVAVVLFLIAHAGYSYIPVAYEGETMKQEMQTAVLQGTALPTTGNPTGVVKQKLQRAVTENNLPPDTFIDVKQVNNVIQARVYYKKQVDMLPFGIYSREYVFDQTAMPSGFLMKNN